MYIRLNLSFFFPNDASLAMGSVHFWNPIGFILSFEIN
jgi:hypothetical protein